MKALENIANWQIRKSFMPEYQATATQEDGLGIAIAHHYEWDGIRICETFYSALEDANFHAEAAVVAEWLEKFRGFFHRDQTNLPAR